MSLFLLLSAMSQYELDAKIGGGHAKIKPLYLTR